MGPRRGGTLDRRAVLGIGLEAGLRATDGDREKERMVPGEHGSNKQSVPVASTEGTDTAPTPGAWSPLREGTRPAQLRGDANLGGSEATSSRKPSFLSSH